MIKKLFKELVILVVVLTTAFSHLSFVSGENTTEEDEPPIEFEFEINKDKTVSITGATIHTNTIVIPETIEDYPVKEVVSDAIDCEDVIAITIADNVEFLEKNSFYNCNSVVELNVPGNCNAAKAFKDLNQLRTLNILKGNGVMHDYQNAYEVPWFASKSSIRILNIDSQITHIGAHSFEGLMNVTDLDLPQQLESIGEYGLYNMIKVKRWELPDSLTTLEKAALGNDSLNDEPTYHEVLLPTGIENVGERSLSRNIKYISFKDSETSNRLKNEDILFEEIDYDLLIHEIHLKVGEEYQLEFKNTPKYLQEMSSFTSNDNSIVKVSNDGHFWAFGLGETSIDVSNGTFRTSAVVKVFADDATKETTRLLRLPIDASNHEINLNEFNELTSYTIRSITANSEFIKVEEDNTITPLQQGRSDLFVTTSNNERVRFIVDVYKPIVNIVTNINEIALHVGHSFQLECSVFPNDVGDVGFVFESTNDNVVSVGNNGKIYANEKGEAEIIVSSRDEDNNATTINVVVTDEYIDLPIWELPMMVGKSFKPFLNRDDLKFYSGNESIATVDETGTIKAISSGECEIVIFNEDKTESSSIYVKTFPANAFGIDVSEWQSVLTYNDWLKVKEFGVDFAILRAAYSYDWVDTSFENNFDKCHEVGIDVGVYHYITALNVEEAKNEARFLLDIIAGKKFEYPVFVDIEEAEHRALSNDEFSDIIEAYCSVIKEAGYYPAIYSYASMLNKCSDQILENYDAWQAHWDTVNPNVFNKPFTIWQYISSGQVSGILTRCDMNLAFFDYPSYIKNNHWNGY